MAFNKLISSQQIKDKNEGGEGHNVLLDSEIQALQENLNDKELIGLYHNRIKTLDEDDTQDSYNHARNHMLFGITPEEYNKSHSSKDNKLK